MANEFLKVKKNLPALGVGLGLRRELAAETFANAQYIDWLEIVPENYMSLGGSARERLERALSGFPLVSHGINLSIGSTDELNCEYLKAIKDLLDYIDAPWWSDHLSFTSFNGTYMHDLLPLPYSREAVEHVVNRVKYVHEFVGRPFLLENISFYMYMPGTELSEAQFLSDVLEKADCGLLLDINNVYVNSINHKFDPYKFLDQIPIERTVQMHIAGHNQGEEMVIDTHGAQVIEPVYELLQYVLERTQVRAIMLERDQNYPDFSELLTEMGRIREIASTTQPSLVRLSNSQARAARISPQASVSKLANATGMNHVAIPA